MKNTSIIVAGFVFVYLIFAIAFIPARFVVQWVDLPKNVQLGALNGTIWSSQVKAIKVDNVIIEKVTLRLQALSLLQLDPKVEVTFGDALFSGPEGQAIVSGLLSSLRLTEVKVSLAANDIAQQLALPLPIIAHDYIDLTIEEFVAGQGLCAQLTGDIRWSKAALTALDEKVSLGSLQATLACRAGIVELQLDEANDLGLSFSASIAPSGHISGSGYLTPSDSMPEALRQIIPFLGQADSQGRYRLRF